MAPPSLVDICTRKCIKHIAMIHDLGDLPSHLAKPILRKVENPAQLREIEMNSPHFQDETPEVWKKLIARDFPNWRKKNYVPKNPKSWYKVYARYRRENDAELAAAQDRLKSAFSALKSAKESRRTGSIQTRDLPPLPKDGRGVGGRPAGRGQPDHLTWGGGSRTKLTDGQSFLKKARREAREIAYRRQLATPTGQLKVPQGQITKAPEAMVHQYRVQQQEALRIRAPRKTKSEAQLAEEAERREREARLLKIKNIAAPRPEQIVSDSEDDEEDFGDEADQKNYRGLGDLFDDDDLFGDGDEDEAASERPPPRKTNEPKKSAATANHSDSSTATPKRSTLLSNSRKPPTGGLLSKAFSPSSQKPVARSLARPAVEPPSRPPARHSSPPLPKPRQPNHSSPPRPPPPLKPPVAAAQASSPPLRPQQSSSTTQAGSPPPIVVRKRKPQVDIFMPQNKKPRK